MKKIINTPLPLNKKNISKQNTLNNCVTKVNILKNMTKKAKIIAGTSVIGVIVITAIIGVVIGTLNSNNNPSKYKSFQIKSWHEFKKADDFDTNFDWVYKETSKIPDDFFKIINDKNKIYLTGSIDLWYTIKSPTDPLNTNAKFTFDNAEIDIYGGEVVGAGELKWPSIDNKIKIDINISRYQYEEEVDKNIIISCISTENNPKIFFKSAFNSLKLNFKYK